MFDKKAFANSVAVVTAVIYIVFAVIRMVAPTAFAFIFNAQFLGADIASLVPDNFSFGNFIGVLVAVVVVCWIFGYLWAWFYNRFARK